MKISALSHVKVEDCDWIKNATAGGICSLTF